MISLSALVLSFVPQLASAAEPSLSERMKTRIEQDFLKPLAAHDEQTSRFSRMRTPPRERRVRMTTTTASYDQAGRSFLSFAIDQKYTGDWQENAITGCINTEKAEVFVKIGDGYRPASFLLGKDVAPVTGVCVAPQPKA